MDPWKTLAISDPYAFPLTLMMFGLLEVEGNVCRKNLIFCQFARGPLLIYVTSRPETAPTIVVDPLPCMA